MKALIAIVAVVGLLVGTVIVSYVTYGNYGNRAEVGVEAEYENLQNVLSQYTLKVMEVAQVPGRYKDDMKDVMTSVMTARQGPEGSKAAFQWFKEHDINLDASVYAKIQTVMEAGRNQYQNSQTRFIDVKKTYVTNLGYFWSGFWLSQTGYPQIEVGYPRGTNDAYPIVKSQAAITSFETGVDEGFKFE